MKQFEEEAFDCVIDKGMLDSILVFYLVNEVWNLLSAEFKKNAC
jgi:hypothetical protein